MNMHLSGSKRLSCRSNILATLSALAFLSLVSPVARRIFRLLSRSRLIKRLSDVGQRMENGGVGTNAKQRKFEYDVIIIGGGTAGCVLASRLSENPDIKILLIESGTSGRDTSDSRVPLMAHRLYHTRYGYDIWTEQQKHAGDKKFFWPRGKMLGGSSSMNSMMYHIGAPSDFDEWASVLGPEGDGWKWQNFRQYFLKFEKFVPSRMYPAVDSSKHNLSGNVEVGYFGYFSKVSSNALQAYKAVGIPLIADFNTDAGPLGASRPQQTKSAIVTYIDSRGRRVSSESAYLTKEVLNRPNLKVVISATVTRILFDNAGLKPRAIGVEFTSDNGGTRYRAYAKQEVILSAGAVHTPQILMLSGVGPSRELNQHSITVIADLPGVGSHLLDHPGVLLRFRVHPRESITFMSGETLMEQGRRLYAFLQYHLFGTGPLTCSVGEAVAFVRSTDPRLFPPEEFGELEDTSSGPEAPDMEFFSSPIGWKDHGHSPIPAGGLMTLSAYITRPTSKGTITLRSSNPFDSPIIDPRYLSTKHDVDVLVRGIKLLLKVASSSPLKEMLIDDPDELLDHRLHILDDTALELYVRKNIETTYHPTSTARMAPFENGGVVNNELFVYGVEGLRIVDASVFTTSVCGHTTAACLALAEKAADMIKQTIHLNK